MQHATCRVKYTFFEYANTRTEHMQNVSILIANFLTYARTLLFCCCRRMHRVGGQNTHRTLPF